MQISPGVLTGTISFVCGSTILTSTCSPGYPIVEQRRSKVSLGSVINVAGLHSVIPYKILKEAKTF